MMYFLSAAADMHKSMFVTIQFADVSQWPSDEILRGERIGLSASGLVPVS